MGAVVGGADQEEQAGTDQAMADHLQHRAAGAEGTETADADQHEPHVTDGAVSDLSLQVPLGEGGQRRIDDVDHPEHDQQWCELGVSGRQQLAVEAQQGVAAHLQQDAGQQHVHRSCGLAMGIRQPGVQGDDRQLDAEGDQQTGVTEQLETGAELLGCQGCVFEAGSAAAEKAHGKSREQDEQRAACGVEDELGGGVLTFLAAPDGQKQIDGNQLQLPGQEEQQHVLDGEDSDLAAIHGQEQKIEQTRLEGHRPGRQTGERGDEAGEQDQWHGKAISAHRPGESEIRKPVHPFGELQTADARVVAVEICSHRDQEGDQGDAQRVPAHLLAISGIRDERDQQGSNDREENRQAEPRDSRIHGVSHPGDSKLDHGRPGPPLEGL